MTANAIFQATFQHTAATALLLYTGGFVALALLWMSVAMWVRWLRFARR